MSYTNRMTLNRVGSSAAGLYVIGLIGYAFTGEVIDICWLFSALLLGIAMAAILGQLIYMMAQSNDLAANYVVAGTLLVCAIFSVLVMPDPDDQEEGYIGTSDNRTPVDAPPPPPNGASNEQLRQAQHAFVGEELSENLRITEALNRVLLDSQRMHSGTTREDLDRMLQRVVGQEVLLTELEDMINTQNERFRRKLLDAGANTDQANELAIAFATSQRETHAENNRRLEAWRRIYELIKQSLTLLRDHHGDWRYDDQRGAVVFRDEEVMKRFGPIQDEMQALIDANR